MNSLIELLLDWICSLFEEDEDDHPEMDDALMDSMLDEIYNIQDDVDIMDCI